VSKIIFSSGQRLTVSDVGAILVEIKAIGTPIKLNGWQIVDDDKARKIVKELKDSGLYEYIDRTKNV
jgi:hypothetical protein